jgi:hypothetical protein
MVWIDFASFFEELPWFCELAPSSMQIETGYSAFRVLKKPGAQSKRTLIPIPNKAEACL